MWDKILIALVIFVMPYSLIGEELSGGITALIGIIYLSLIVNKNIKLKFSKGYFILIISLIASAIFSMVISPNLVKSLSAISLYVNVAIYYVVFSSMIDEKEDYIKWLVYTATALALIFIIIQGVIYKSRIYGNIGYANTYGLILVVTLYLNELLNSKKFYLLVQIILCLGIIYTGSRNSLIYLFIFIIYMTVQSFKSKGTLESLLSVSLAALLYIIISYSGIGILIFVPPIIYFLIKSFNRLKSKTANKIIVGIIFMVILAGIFLKTNTIERIKNASIQSGVFQERLVYFQDALNQIIKRPLGHGINSFEYLQYSSQTAFYDVKYIHNSFLQITYDLGVIGLIVFIALFIYGLKAIINSKSNNRIYLMLAYITIYFHSILDFDFSYSTIFIITIMLVAFASDKDGINVRKQTVISISGVVSVLLLYIILINSFYVLGNYYMKQGKYSAARKMYSYNSKLAPKDSEAYYYLASTYKMEYDYTSSIEAIDRTVSNLKTAENLNDKDSRVVWDIAYSYEKINNDTKTIEYMDKLIQSERFYYKAYQLYYNYLKEQYDKTGKIYYNNKFNKLKKLYEDNLKQLNPKAKYMKNQLHGTFEEIIKME